jgi:hypothetical protein
MGQNWKNINSSAGRARRRRRDECAPELTLFSCAPKLVRVRHRIWGNGSAAESQDESTTVLFDDGQSRRVAWGHLDRI